MRLGTPGRPRPGIVRVFRWALGPLLTLAHRPRLTGWEHLPPDRPYLLVSNHSGGGGADVLVFAWLWLRRFDAERPITAMAHPLTFLLPGIAWLVRSLGAIPSTYAAAGEALGKGLPILIYPGGDHEAFRPLWQAARVDFNGRQGFLKIARQAWVPVVPLGVWGTHPTVPILWRSRRILPWLTGVRLWGSKRVPLTVPMLVVVPLLIAGLGPTVGYGWAALIAWATLAIPVLYFIPVVPWTVRMQVGAPLEPEALFGARGEEAPLEPAYEQVVAAVQAQVLAARGR